METRLKRNGDKRAMLLQDDGNSRLVIEIFIAPFPFRLVPFSSSIDRNTFLVNVPKIRGFRFIRDGSSITRNLHDKVVLPVDSRLSGSSVVRVSFEESVHSVFILSRAGIILENVPGTSVAFQPRGISPIRLSERIECFNWSDTDRYFQLDLAIA